MGREAVSPGHVGDTAFLPGQKTRIQYENKPIQIYWAF